MCGTRPRACKLSGSRHDRGPFWVRRGNPRRAPCPGVEHPESRLCKQRSRITGGTSLVRYCSVFALAFLLSACLFQAPSESPSVGILPDDDTPGDDLPTDDPPGGSPGDNNAFGNIQPHHVEDPQFHDAIVAHGSTAVYVCNAALPSRGLLDDLRTLVGPDATLLANDNSAFVPLWGEGSELWEAYRAAMDPATAGLPDSAWYWLDEFGDRQRAPKPCNDGWCGDYWPGWALKPDTSAYRVKAEFVASHLADFDGVWLDDWREGIPAYTLEGLEIPADQQDELSQQWVECRVFYVDVLRQHVRPGTLLIPNIQRAQHTSYAPSEMVRFDGFTCEFPDEVDLVRFETYPSPYNVGWTGYRIGLPIHMDVPGVVRAGFGLPANVDP